MEFRQAEDNQRDAFNEFVASTDAADVLQSWEWGEVKSRTGWKPFRLIAEDGGQIVASCSVLATRPTRGVPPILYAPRGPLLNFENRDLLESFVTAAKTIDGGFTLIADPGLETGSAGAEALSAMVQPKASGGFGSVQPKAVMILDLSDGADSVFEGFKSKWRYNIRLAERKGVVVREAGRSDLPAFYSILEITAQRDGFSIRNFNYFETLWDELAQTQKIKLFMADFQGSPIAGVMLFCMGPRVTYTYGASSNEHRKVMPNHLLQWNAMKWSIENGFKIYDFRGVSPVRDGEPTQPHIAGLNRFKEGFGARYVEYPGQFEFPLRPLWHAVWKAAGPIANSLGKRLRRTEV